MLQLNTASLYNVLRDFYTLTQIRIVIFDTDFRELLSYPTALEGFCAHLRRSSEGDAACRASDRNGCKKCAQTRQLVRYHCHAGLTEAVVPILDKNGVLAFVMFGQVIQRENCSTVKGKIKSNYPDLAQIVDRIPVKSATELDAAATVLQAITSYVMSNRWVVPEKSEFIWQLDQYIASHLNQNINVDDICEAFHIGRTKLYEVSSAYLGCGLAEYIRKQRILHAQQMLKQSDISITDVAYSVGFSDYNHFSRIFKRETGCSARAYRTHNQTYSKK